MEMDGDGRSDPEDRARGTGARPKGTPATPALARDSLPMTPAPSTWPDRAGGRRAVKLLALVSALDLRYRYSSTPHWWHLLKALALEGVDVIAIPYVGPPVESLYWRVYDNPCRVASEVAHALRTAWRGAARHQASAPVRWLARAYVRRRWIHGLDRLFARERGVGAVVVFNQPLDHIAGVAAHVRRRHGVPVWYYDGDMPASLPGHGGFSTGFSTPPGTDYAEYDGFMINSGGSAARLLELGARRVEVVHWAADPDVYRPLSREEEHDVLFYGHGEQYRRDWLEAMLYEPSRRMADVSFAVGGLAFDTAPGAVRPIGDVPFCRLSELCARARINLIVTRAPHASVPQSSSARPFELGAMARASVCNPWPGVETWFEPGREILVVSSLEEAMATYRDLLAHPDRRRALGEAMRRRVETEHTYAHRARQVLAALSI
jgi:hypothetical protein